MQAETHLECSRFASVVLAVWFAGRVEHNHKGVGEVRDMRVLKLWAWRAIAFVALMALLPTFLIMGEAQEWRRVWAEAMGERA